MAEKRDITTTVIPSEEFSKALGCDDSEERTNFSAGTRPSRCRTFPASGHGAK